MITESVDKSRSTQDQYSTFDPNKKQGNLEMGDRDNLTNISGVESPGSYGTGALGNQQNQNQKHRTYN